MFDKAHADTYLAWLNDGSFGPFCCPCCGVANRSTTFSVQRVREPVAAMRVSCHNCGNHWLRTDAIPHRFIPSPHED